MKNSLDIDDSYFINNAIQYAKFQGRTVQDKEFVEQFQKQLDNLPNNRALRKKWLEQFINTSTNEYNDHILKTGGNCQPYCEPTIGYRRGIPHAQAELLKIDPMYLWAEKIVIFLKGLPSRLFKKGVGLLTAIFH